MVSIGIGHEDVLIEAKFNFQDFTQIDDLFLDKLLSLEPNT